MYRVNAGIAAEAKSPVMATTIINSMSCEPPLARPPAQVRVCRKIYSHDRIAPDRVALVLLSTYLRLFRNGDPLRLPVSFFFGAPFFHQLCSRWLYLSYLACFSCHCYVSAVQHHRRFFCQQQIQSSPSRQTVTCRRHRHPTRSRRDRCTAHPQPISLRARRPRSSLLRSTASRLRVFFVGRSASVTCVYCFPAAHWYSRWTFASGIGGAAAKAYNPLSLSLIRTNQAAESV